ncbi:hydroxylysine kinase-like [Oppia nitens]|uniref:hydroxylysine kinase-like n=1 Tax=Oppia nitens TaxID=1686743 RepID=UPI0023DBF38B|nr:hydroxylysine kinase-like [Oppia nitens]
MGIVPKNVEFNKQLVKRLYNYDIQHMKELNGYDDRNYHLITTDSKEFILKITNKLESSQEGLLDSLNSLILHLYNNGFKVTVPQINTNGKYLSFEDIPQEGQQENAIEKPYGVRLLEYIPGELLRGIPFTPEILEECGQVLAKMTITLQSYDSDVLQKRTTEWSLLRALDVRQYIDDVESEENRCIVRQSLDEFERTVMSRLHEFKHCIIHGDFNEMNIIVDKNLKMGNDYHVKGIIDFGDSHYAPQLFDLAIHLCYSILMFTAGPVIYAPAFGLRGYQKFVDLNNNELNALYSCIKARLCQSLVLGAHSSKLDPTNTYVLTTAKTGWSALKALHDCNPKDLLSKWLNIDKYM